jgi:SAM-dependent methyltransferase
MNNGEVFKNIYENRLWSGANLNIPLSGPGSLPDRAIPYVRFTKEVISNLQITSVLDVGHGDWEMWESYKFEDVRYVGVDVVEGLSNKLEKIYGSATRTFFPIDITNTLPPDADLLICKDTLMHLPNRDIIYFLRNLKKFKYLIICNDVNFVSSKLNNYDIKSVEYRGIDLESLPYARNLRRYRLIEKFDYDDRDKSNGYLKRVYLYKKGLFRSPISYFVN